MNSEPVIIYTDGGASPNPGFGGWAAILMYGGHEKIVTGNDPNTTNNRMELTAATRALMALKRPSSVILYTDSEYLRQGITKWIDGWLAKGRLNPGPKQVANADLWLDLYPLTKYHEIEWKWVRGHSGNMHNERVDQLVHQARLEIMPKVETGSDALTLYVKGSCKKGEGGWGALLEQKDELQAFSGAESETTSNRMELQALLNGLSHVEPGSIVRIVTTSDYLHQGATQWIHGWEKRDWQKKTGGSVANVDLWQQLATALKQVRPAWINSRGQKVERIDLALKTAQDAIKSE